MPTVTIFNTNSLSLQMSVNNGPQFSVAGAGGPGWTPQSPTSGNPGWSNTSPAPNTFAPGSNFLTVTPEGGTAPCNTTISLPSNMPWNSLQLYIYFNGYNELAWTALNAGQFVAGSAQRSAQKSAGEDHRDHKA